MKHLHHLLVTSLYHVDLVLKVHQPGLPQHGDRDVLSENLKLRNLVRRALKSPKTFGKLQTSQCVLPQAC